jgi:hypothetical protein
MADIFNEIDEDLRRDQLRKLWDRFGVYILAIAALIVVGVAGWRGYVYWQAKIAAETGDRYYHAARLSSAGDHKAATEAFAVLESTGTGGYAAIAALRGAAELALGGDTEAALRSYDAIAASPKTPQTFAEVARIRAGYLAVDREDRAAVDRRMAPLAGGAQPWRHAAREIQALAAWKAGDVPATKAKVEQILGDADTPRDIQSRAELLQGLIQAATPVAKPAAGAVTQ